MKDPIQASESLSKKYISEKWYVAVGIGDNQLFLYVNSDTVPLLEEWEGISVITKNIGRPRHIKGPK